jgi:hypothetical protein
LEHEQLEVTQPTAQEDQIEVEELTALKEEACRLYKHLTLLFTRPQCGNALSLLLEFKKEINSGFHLVMVVVDHALDRQVPIIVQSVVVQRPAFDNLQCELCSTGMENKKQHQAQNSILDDVSFKSEDPSFLLKTQESPDNSNGETVCRW